MTEEEIALIRGIEQVDVSLTGIQHLHREN